jgi:hypothetical protein
MPPVLDNDVDSPSRAPQYPVSDQVRTYLQHGSRFFGPGADRGEQPELARAQDLWDYLGDFA